MNCKFCGARLLEGDSVCPECSREQSEPYVSGGNMPPMLSAGAFWRQRYFRKLPVILSGILCLVCAGLAFYVGYYTPTIKLMCLIDVAVIAGCGFFITLFRSRLFALLLTVYALVLSVLTLVRFSGTISVLDLLLKVLLLVAAGLGLTGTFRFRCRYKRYKHEYRLRSRMDG